MAAATAPSPPSGAPPDGGRRAALAELREATRTMHHAAAVLRTAGLLSDRELRQHQQFAKVGERVTDTREVSQKWDVPDIRRVAAGFRARAAAYAARAPLLVGSPASPPVPATAGGPPPSGPETAAAADNGAAGADAVDPGEVVDAAPVDAPPDVAEQEGPMEAQATPARADGLTKAREEWFARRYLFVSLVQGGLDVKTAIERAKLVRERKSGTKKGESVPLSVKQGRRLIEAYKARGADGLRDARWDRRNAPRVFTPAVQDLALQVWWDYPAAGEAAVWKEVKELVKGLGLPKPGYHVVYRFLTGRPEAEKQMRAGNVKRVRQGLNPVVRFQMATRANERWQTDDSPLDIWVRVEGPDGEPVLAQVWITAILDERSRTIPGFALTTAPPDAQQVALALRNAIRRKAHPRWVNYGIGDVLQPDRGKNFNAARIAASCGYLKIRLDPDPPHYPNRKGKVERFFQTLDSGCLRRLPGHKEAVGRSTGAAQKRVHQFITVPDLRDEIAAWIATEYHQTPHSELLVGRKRETPEECWLRTVGVPREPESDDALHLLLMATDERKVHNVGIRFNRRTYYAPELAGRVQSLVTLRHDPDDEGSVLVYEAGTQAFVCEAVATPELAPGDADYGPDGAPNPAGDAFREAGSEYTKGLLARNKQRQDEQDREGRVRVAKAAGAELAAAAAARSPAAPPGSPTPAPPRRPAAPSQADVLLRRLQQRARGEDDEDEDDCDD